MIFVTELAFHVLLFFTGTLFLCPVNLDIVITPLQYIPRPVMVMGLVWDSQLGKDRTMISSAVSARLLHEQKTAGFRLVRPCCSLRMEGAKGTHTIVSARMVRGGGVCMRLDFTG